MPTSSPYLPQWGAHLQKGNRGRFRLWAPRVDRLSLRLDDQDRPMTAVGGGWFAAEVDGAQPGMDYAFVLPDGMVVPDPASQQQRGDVYGTSLLVDHGGYRWQHPDWCGRPWTEAVVYELHVGTFTPEGTFRAAAERLKHLAELGITAVELMPIGQFPGGRGWGYDGVLPYAPHPTYGSPDDLKHLIDQAHGLGLMVLLDVVYNHFGPEGNYLSAYAPEFFDGKRHTPWGAGIAYEKQPVRRFFIDNALYWLDTFRFDGLRLDAVDQIIDVAEPELLIELARTVRASITGRHIHLVTEDNRNVAHLHRREGRRPLHYTAEWNDDFHNAAHVLLTAETEGYYTDFAEDAFDKVVRCLAEGYAYQGECSAHEGGRPRGEPCGELPTTAFVNFLQNHDQVGNRALGERLEVLATPERILALEAIMLLAPHVPLLFMGEDWAARQPFLFFTDYEGELADMVREGRRQEFSGFSAHGEAEAVPDPNDEATFLRSVLDWSAADTREGKARLAFIRSLLALRHRHIVPLLDDGGPSESLVLASDGGALAINWTMAGRLLQLRANLAEERQSVPGIEGKVIHPAEGCAKGAALVLDPWSVVVAIGD